MARRPIRNLEKRILSFIERERAATWRQALELYELSPHERAEEGECMTGLRLLEVEGSEASFRVRENLSKFRPGDPLFLGDGIVVPAGSQCEFSDYDPVEQIIKVSFRWSGRGAVQNLERGKDYVLDRRVVDLFHKRAGAVEAAFSEREYVAASEVMSLQTDQRSYTRSKSKAERLMRGLDLNPSQRDAFITGYTTSPALIQGPPGTGKTYLLAQLAKTLARYDSERVLICCFTHRAINNALNAVASLGFYDLFKISGEHHVDGLDKRVEWEPSWKYLDIPEESCIVGATPYGAFNMAGNKHFDVVIFDEAGQLTLDLALMGMCCADRWVFVGDHMQMAPVLTASHTDKIVRRSAFEHLFSAYPSVMLDVTYRMNTGICLFPSTHFYGGCLEPSEEAKERSLEIKDGGAFQDILDPDLRSVFVEVNHLGMQMRSPDEAKLIAHIVLELISRHGIPPSEIAVIAPFRAQVREIRTQLARLAKKKQVDIGDELVVDTVERIQGQEREVILVSFTSSDAHFLKNKVGFYFNPNRLNVAITRARVKRIMVGSKHAFRVRPTDLEDIRMVNVFKKLFRQTPRLDYSKRVRSLK